MFLPIADGIFDPVTEVSHRWMEGAVGRTGFCHAEIVSSGDDVVLWNAAVIRGLRKTSQGVDEVPWLAEHLQSICPRALRVQVHDVDLHSVVNVCNGTHCGCGYGLGSKHTGASAAEIEDGLHRNFF